MIRVSVNTENSIKDLLNSRFKNKNKNDKNNFVNRKTFPK
jgi:hypothetical protein